MLRLKHSRRRLVSAFLAATLAVIMLCSSSAHSQSADKTSDSARQWDAFVDQFLSDYFALHPDFAMQLGKHEFDGKFPDWSEAGLTKTNAWLHEQRRAAEGFKDGSLDDRGRLERDYLISRIDAELFWREIVDQPHRTPFFYSEALDPDVYISRPYAPLETRIKSFTAYARNVPAALKQAKVNLKLPLPISFIKIGRTTIGGLAGFFTKDVPQVFEPVKDEKSQAEFKEATVAAIQAIREFDAWLAEQEPKATDDFALGPEKFSLMLKMTEGVDIPLARLEEIAQRDLERNLEALRVQCASYAPGKSVAECMTLVNAHKAEGNGAVDAATRQLAALRTYLDRNEIVTIPGTEAATVAQAPSYKAWNFAYINIPGPFEKNLPSIYYVAPPDPTWTKEVQDAYVPGAGGLMFTSVHEVYPGHFVQFLHANRSALKLGQIFTTYAFAEGWAHYTEEMMYDAGLGASDPEMHIGQLQEALLRNVRFMSAIGLHTKGMTVAESKKMFREVAFIDEGNAAQQAMRGTFDPAYLNYTLGKLMIRKLRDDWTATRGGRAAWKQFHDAFLQFGGPPIPLVRRALLGEGDKGPLF
jgi:uncharacterized protein (DUF885 family)